MTNNLTRRLRQHNQELVGGAKKTKNHTWKFVLILSGHTDMVNCLQCEWKILHPNGTTKGRPDKYRVLKDINKVLNLEKWTKNSTVLNKDQQFTLWVENTHKQWINFEKLPKNFTITETNECIK